MNNEWQPMKTAPRDATAVELRMRFPIAPYEPSVASPRRDGYWRRAAVWTPLAIVTGWRPAKAKFKVIKVWGHADKRKRSRRLREKLTKRDDARHIGKPPPGWHLADRTIVGRFIVEVMDSW